MSQSASDLLDRRAQQQNEEIYPNFIREVDRGFGVQEKPIYVYNISQREFNVPRPPNFPHLFLRACPKGEPYLQVGQLSHPYRQIEFNQNNERVVRMVDGYVEATRVLSPLNPGTDQDFDAPHGLVEGGNLNRYGVFWSVNNPPLQSELDAARVRMEASYRTELERMNKAKTADEAREMANDISHFAANYFGLSFSWHQSNLAAQDAGKVDCGVCAEKIQAGAKLCVHCGAPTDEEKQARWLEDRFAEKRGPGRPRKDE